MATLTFRLLAAAILPLAAWQAPAAAAVGRWTSIGPDGGGVNLFAVDPQDRSVVYAATASSGVFKSVDGGATWAAVNDGLPDGGVLALAIDPTRPSTLYAAMEYPGSGLFISGDGGALWRPASISPSLGEMGLVCDPDLPDTVYALKGADEVWVSRNRGGRWKLSTRFADVYDLGANLGIAADPVHSLILAVVGHPGGFKLHGSADHGATWNVLSATLPLPVYPIGWQLVADPEPPGALYLAYSARGPDGTTAAATYQSDDAGRSWHPAGPGGFPIAVGPGHVVYAGSYRSADLGRSWTRIAAPAFMVQALAVGASPDAVYAADGTVGGVRRSSDGGRSWQASSRGLRASSAVALAIDPSNPARLYAYEANEGFFASGDRGGHWRGGTCIPWACAPDLNALTLAVDPVDSSTVYMASPEGLYKSTDRGGVLAQVQPRRIGCLYIGSLVVAPTSPATLYAAGGLYSSACGSGATPECTVFKSLDGGESWDCLGVDAISIAMAPSSPSTLYAVGFDGATGSPVLRSTDQGATWEVVNAAAPMFFPNFPYVPFLTVDPAEPRRLYAVDFFSGLWRSVNGGRTWREIYNPGCCDYLLIAIDPFEPGVLYVASSQGGVVRSADFGRTWQPLLAGLPQGYFFSHYLQLLADPRHSGTIYLATDNHGVLTYTVPKGEAAGGSP